MLVARDLTLRRGPLPLFDQVHFDVYRGDKIGLTGANGTGKSSLFAAVRGELAPDRGDIKVIAACRIAHVEQEIVADPRPALEFVLDGDTQLRSAQAAIDAAVKLDEPLKLAEAHATFEAIDGYRAPARAAAVMHGLGFETRQLERPAAELSGGWRVRLAMARALSSRADLLLLDEPTNHLDLDAILWLEGWLRSFAGTLLMISHDREFLDAIIDRVFHIENGRIAIYSGNYSQFEKKRSEELALQAALQVRQARRIAEISAFVNRFRASATKSRQAQSRLKMLERMERIVPAHVDSPFDFEFAAPLKTPRPLLTLERAACGYEGRPLISGIDFSVSPRDRIALLGPNGAGKSTFMKLLAGESAPLSGKLIAAADLNIGYFAQQQLEHLRTDCDAFWHLRNLGGPEFAAGDEQRVRDHLGRFGFSGERAFEPVGTFSGGEKARLTLALLVARRPNLLLLDEPTNHLDIDMRHALTLALQNFTGGLVVVSHDRHLINSVADTLLLVADGKLKPFDGDLEDYQKWLQSRGRTARESLAKGQGSATAKGAAGKAGDAAGTESAKQRSRDPIAKLRRQLEQVERRLEQLAAERRWLDAQEASGDESLARRRANLARDAAVLEAQWIEIGTALEAAENS